MTETTDHACPVCHQPRDKSSVCPTCVAHVDHMLEQLLELSIQSATALIPSRRGTTTRSIPSSRPPLDLAALDLELGEILLMTDESDDVDEPPWTGLEAWEQDWRNLLHLTPYGPASAHRTARGQTTLSGVITFLRANWPLAATDHPTPGEFATDVRRMWSHAIAALRLTPFDLDPDPNAKEPPAFTIACPGDHPDQPGQLCGRRLPIHRQPLDLDDRPPRSVSVFCQTCSTSWTGERLLLVARAVGVGATMSADEACAWFATTPRGLAIYLRAGLLERAGSRYRLPTDTPDEAGA